MRRGVFRQAGVQPPGDVPVYRVPAGVVENFMPGAGIELPERLPDAGSPEAAAGAADAPAAASHRVHGAGGKHSDGTNDEVMSLGDLPAKTRAFGLETIEVADGNDLEQVLSALNAPTVPGKPKCIIAHTVKGKGVSFMENQVGWHGKAPNAEQREQALRELA